MKGKNLFTSSEIDTIKKLIAEKLKAKPDKQKGIRQKIRDIGFHYSDFTPPQEGYTVAGFEELLRSGQIRSTNSNATFSEKLREAIEEPQPSISQIPTKSNFLKSLSGSSQLNFNDVDEIKKFGFIGFQKMSELFLDSSSLPGIKGVYMILNLKNVKPVFLTLGTGGFFKGKNPNVSLEQLKANWIDNTIVIYIGKAGNDGSNATLKSRLKQYFGFGQGKNIGHYGGRLIWQLKNSSDLIVCWKPLPLEDPRIVEASLISLFVSKFGNRPFANLAD